MVELNLEKATPFELRVMVQIMFYDLQECRRQLGLLPRKEVSRSKNKISWKQ